MLRYIGLPMFRILGDMPWLVSEVAMALVFRSLAYAPSLLLFLAILGVLGLFWVIFCKAFY
jgi:hypothetical protein